LALVQSPDLLFEGFPAPGLSVDTARSVLETQLLCSIADDARLASDEFSRLSRRAAASARLLAGIENRLTRLENARRVFQAEREPRLPDQTALSDRILSSEWLDWVQSQSDELNALNLAPENHTGSEIIGRADLALRRLRDFSKRELDSAAQREEILEQARNVVDGLIFLGHVRLKEAQTLHEVDKNTVYDAVAALAEFVNSATAARGKSETAKPIDF
jgi:hypothetical protein